MRKLNIYVENKILCRSWVLGETFNSLTARILSIWPYDIIVKYLNAQFDKQYILHVSKRTGIEPETRWKVLLLTHLAETKIYVQWTWSLRMNAKLTIVFNTRRMSYELSTVFWYAMIVLFHLFESDKIARYLEAEAMFLYINVSQFWDEFDFNTGWVIRLTRSLYFGKHSFQRNSEFSLFSVIQKFSRHSTELG